MGIDLRFPNITGTTPAEQMAQMQSYMHQLVQQLNWALNTVDEAQSGNTSNVVINDSSGDISPKEAEDTFNSIKALIIKSADIVKAYEETIMTDFNGTYFADSDFGTYIADTKHTIEQNSIYTDERFTKVETITNGLESEVKNTNAYIKRGELGYHDRLEKDVYGIAVGQTNDDGVYNKYAWFISEGLCLFDGNGNEVAYISQNKLHIKDAMFYGTVRFGDYQVDTSEGIAFTWVGKEI